MWMQFVTVESERENETGREKRAARWGERRRRGGRRRNKRISRREEMIGHTMRERWVSQVESRCWCFLLLSSGFLQRAHTASQQALLCVPSATHNSALQLHASQNMTLTWVNEALHLCLTTGLWHHKPGFASWVPSVVGQQKHFG